MIIATYGSSSTALLNKDTKSSIFDEILAGKNADELLAKLSDEQKAAVLAKMLTDEKKTEIYNEKLTASEKAKIFDELLTDENKKELSICRCSFWYA